MIRFGIIAEKSGACQSVEKDPFSRRGKVVVLGVDFSLIRKMVWLLTTQSLDNRVFPLLIKETFSLYVLRKEASTTAGSKHIAGWRGALPMTDSRCL